MGVTDRREEHVRGWIMESRDLVFYNILLPSLETPVAGLVGGDGEDEGVVAGFILLGEGNDAQVAEDLGFWGGAGNGGE
jgi:hypothetical protein